MNKLNKLIEVALLCLTLAACGTSPSPQTSGLPNNSPAVSPAEMATQPPAPPPAQPPASPPAAPNPQPLESPIQPPQAASTVAPTAVPTAVPTTTDVVEAQTQTQVQSAQVSPLAVPNTPSAATPIAQNAQSDQSVVTTSVPVTLTPVAFLPAIRKAAIKRVLFINGDHNPETNYPHSRVLDDGSKPESFTRLRKEVLEGQLALTVDEFILTANNVITPDLLAPNVLVVLGSNSRVLGGDEVQALTNYYNAGGSILTYADFQYGPDNWASDNNFLNQFGIEVFPDNFQPATVITDLLTTDAIVANVRSFATEGSSQFLIKASALGRIVVVAKCAPLERAGCALQPPELAKIQPGDVVACTWTRLSDAGGKLAGTCDRNTFHNGPGPGTDIDQFDNRTYATNLFRWLTQ